jgi:hypothetical protein
LARFSERGRLLAPTTGLRTTAGRVLPPRFVPWALFGGFGGELGFDAVEEAVQAALEAARLVQELEDGVEAGVDVLAEEVVDQRIVAACQFAFEEVEDLRRPATLVLFLLLQLAQGIAEDVVVDQADGFEGLVARKGRPGRSSTRSSPRSPGAGNPGGGRPVRPPRLPQTHHGLSPASPARKSTTGRKALYISAFRPVDI